MITLAEKDMGQDQRNDQSVFQVLIKEMSLLSDFRESSRIYYSLEEILFLTFCGVLSGCESYNEIEDFGELRLDWLRNYLPYSNGVPSHDTINRLMSILNTRELERMLANWSNYELSLPDGSVVHIDGKRLGRSSTVKQKQLKVEQGGRQARFMVNAYCSALNVCLASTLVGSKSGEKQSIASILSLLDLSTCLLTLDAGYCYADVAEQIREEKADYLMGLKKNQPKLLELAEVLLEEQHNWQSQYEQTSQGHGRIEKRNCQVIWIKEIEQRLSSQQRHLLSRWKDLTCLIRVHRTRTDMLKDKQTQEQAYYISSLSMNAEQANGYVRSHWQIENELHWQLDTVFGEDRSTKRNKAAAENFSCVRKMAFNKLKAYEDKKVSFNRKMKKCAMSTLYLENVLGFS
jgi:predicted transposase YbfD/YdcC